MLWALKDRGHGAPTTPVVCILTIRTLKYIGGNSREKIAYGSGQEKKLQRFAGGRKDCRPEVSPQSKMQRFEPHNLANDLQIFGGRFLSRIKGRGQRPQTKPGRADFIRVCTHWSLYPKTASIKNFGYKHPAKPYI